MSQYFEYEVEEEHDGFRLDVYLAECVEDASRSFIKKLIKDENVIINGNLSSRPSRILRLGQTVGVELPPPPETHLSPEDIPLEILHEDSEMLIVNKQSGLVVHPAPGNRTGTLVNAVLHHCKDFQMTGEDAIRPGIVHRLDKFTSGVMVVAKTPSAFDSLARQSREHTFDRRYLALIRGEFPEDRGKINATIGRSISDRTKMSVTGLRGKEAVTHFEVVERFGLASLISLRLETGRTHQIRVHLRFAGHPVLGDPVYGVTDFSKWVIDSDVLKKLKALNGQALHAGLLGVEHPSSAERVSFTAPPPQDFNEAVQALRTLVAR